VRISDTQTNAGETLPPPLPSVSLISVIDLLANIYMYFSVLSDDYRPAMSLLLDILQCLPTARTD